MATGRREYRTLEQFDNMMGKVAMHEHRIFGPEASSIIYAIQQERQRHTENSHQNFTSQRLEQLWRSLMPRLPRDIQVAVESAAAIH